ncbi:hypothetical protein CYMTET_17008 [Cymbomonas tetramitiformis]|uniref:Uncharacterized protein n=1 Tax=Cymbomonas tetramitiformis TaxID=36881 RepID=A0AAE0L7D4_9CHLO|nr:hypothetical protein CYMTET_17008 [Cymbomonas tetramitiformis]
MPSLGTNASKKKTVKLEDEYFALAKPAALTDGIEGTTISFKEALKTYIEQHNPPGTNVTVQLAGDGAQVFRSVSHCTVAFKIIVNKPIEDDKDFHGLNSPLNHTSVLVFEGKEDFSEVKQCMERVINELKDAETNGIVVGGGAGDYIPREQEGRRRHEVDKYEVWSCHVLPHLCVLLL